MPELPVVFSSEALAQVDAIDAWWRANRAVAPDLFWQEIEDAVALLARLPQAGHPYHRAGIPGVRRYLLRASRYHIYYVASIDAIAVLSVWSALRGTGPDLRELGPA